MSDRRRVNHGTAKQRMGLNDHDKDDRSGTERRVGERRKQLERRIRYDTPLAGTHQDRRVQPRQRRLGSERRGADKQGRAVDSNYESAKEIVEETVNFFELDAFDGQIQECINRAWDILDRHKADRHAAPVSTGEGAREWKLVVRSGQYGWEGIDCPRCGQPIRLVTGGGGKGHSHPMLLSHVSNGSSQCPTDAPLSSKPSIAVTTLGFEVDAEGESVLLRDSEDSEWTDAVVWARSAPETIVTMLRDLWNRTAELERENKRLRDANANWEFTDQQRAAEWIKASEQERKTHQLREAELERQLAQAYGDDFKDYERLARLLEEYDTAMGTDRDFAKGFARMMRQAELRAESAERRVEELRRGLSTYARHLASCANSVDARLKCTCGLAALLAGEGE